MYGESMLLGLIPSIPVQTLIFKYAKFINLFIQRQFFIDEH